MKPVHFNEICYLLTHEPFCYTFEQIGQLNPYQVKSILFRRPNSESKLSLRDAFFIHWRGKGLEDDEIKLKYKEYQELINKQRQEKKQRKKSK